MIAPEIFRKRYLIEGFYNSGIDEFKIRQFFDHITETLDLTIYGDPIIHKTGDLAKNINQGYDAFVPLSESGIYLGAWVNKGFLSIIIYSCKDFDTMHALKETMDFFEMIDIEHKRF